MIKPYKISVSDNTLKSIYKKVENYPWEEIPLLEGWSHGTNIKYIKDLSKYWINEFNWKSYENKINKFSNFLTNINGLDVHFIKEKGSGSNPMPLIIMHGWPGSVLEFLDINPKWSDGMLGIMQLIVLSHMNQALTKRFI